MGPAERTFVIGTAGHIDHGKTSLVRALTGVETDRLAEERRRGITIELGFAGWSLAPGFTASIVDVPGHENFVRTMIAGAGGIDLVVLVVSAEDGVMPQTREHLNICRLLGVKRGIVALSKIDRLGTDTEAIELAMDDVREALLGSVFETAPMIPCSAVTKDGLQDLTAATIRLLEDLPSRDKSGDVVLPLDRVFSIKGHGTVVTGTLQRGLLDLGHERTWRLEPRGERREATLVRARAAQIRGTQRAKVAAGTRVALNLGGVDTRSIARGDVITSGHCVGRTGEFLAWLEHLPGHGTPWKADEAVQLCIGTASTTARLLPLRLQPLNGEAEPADISIPAGRQGLVRVQLAVPLPIWRGARLVLRAFSGPNASVEGLTVGGGWLVDPMPATGRGRRDRWLAVGQSLAESKPQDRARALLVDAGARGIGTDEVAHRAGLDDAKSQLNHLTQGAQPVAVALGSNRYVDRSALQALVDQAVARLERFHLENPMEGGLARVTLERMITTTAAIDVAAAALARAIEQNKIQSLGGDLLAIPGKGVQNDSAVPQLMQAVLDLYDAAGISPPTIREVAEQVALQPREITTAIRGLQRTGRLVKVTETLSFSATAHEDLLRRVREHLSVQGMIDVQALKTMTGLSRKFVVPFLEHLDSLQITLRQGDRRIPGPKA